MMFGGQQATPNQPCRPVTGCRSSSGDSVAAHLQRVHVEELAALQRDAGQHPVQQHQLDLVGVPLVPGRQQHAASAHCTPPIAAQVSA